MTKEIALQAEGSGVMQFFDNNIETWANETLIEDTKAVARAANMSQDYIDSIIFVKTGFAKGKVVNIHPHAKKIENGTKPHKIRTKGGRGARSGPKALKIPPKFKGGILDNVDHPGTRPMLIMTKGEAIGFPRFLQLVQDELRNFTENN